MAVEKDQDAEAEVVKAAKDKKKKKPGFWSQKWFLISLLVGSFMAHGLGFTLYTIRFANSENLSGMEFELGKFEFLSKRTPESTIETAKFNLFISLLSEVDSPARLLLKRHQYKVHQGIEELLRQAHEGDFDDPTLQELKRQLQATINKTIKKKVIDEVIITDLAIKHLVKTETKEAEDKTKEAEIPVAAEWLKNSPSS